MIATILVSVLLCHLVSCGPTAVSHVQIQWPSVAREGRVLGALFPSKGWGGGHALSQTGKIHVIRRGWGDGGGWGWGGSGKKASLKEKLIAKIPKKSFGVQWKGGVGFSFGGKGGNGGWTSSSSQPATWGSGWGSYGGWGTNLGWAQNYGWGGATGGGGWGRPLEVHHHHHGGGGWDEDYYDDNDDDASGRDDDEDDDNDDDDESDSKTRRDSEEETLPSQEGQRVRNPDDVYYEAADEAEAAALVKAIDGLRLNGEEEVAEVGRSGLVLPVIYEEVYDSSSVGYDYWL